MAETDREAPGSGRVLTMSTVAFTLMFAVWLMFGILGKPIQKEFHLTDVQLAWVTAVAVLNGSIWRLPAGMLADRIGGRKVMTFLLASGAVASWMVQYAETYHMLLVLAFLVGFVGNSFSVGIAWNSAWFTPHHQGAALGLFGAGNVGASITKFIGPAIITATAGSTWYFGVEGGWRVIPVIYAILLAIWAVLTWVITPSTDRMPGSSKSISEMLSPLRHVQVWRFSLYYVVVFGAYVALAAVLPKYYIDNYEVSLAAAGLITATFIFPASLFRPVGGWAADKWGARRVMYATFSVLLVSTAVLAIPSGTKDGEAFGLPLWLFVVVVFIVGCAMGMGKAAVYKHIPTYFPDHVGSVGGLVGMLGGLGGFILPPLFAYTNAWTDVPSSTFAVLFVFTLVAALWMHAAIGRMKRDANEFPDPAPEPGLAGATSPAPHRYQGAANNEH